MIPIDTKSKPIKWAPSAYYQGQIDSDSGYHLYQSSSNSRIWFVGREDWNCIVGKAKKIKCRGLKAAKQWCEDHKQRAVSELVQKLNSLIE